MVLSNLLMLYLLRLKTMIDIIPQQLTPPSDEEWEILLDLDRLERAQEAAYKERKSLDEDDIRKLRRVAKTNLFYLCYAVLGYTKLTPKFHGHVCKWLDNTKIEWLYRLLLLARSHFKSTIDTISDSIQTALPDDEGDQPYPYNLGTDVRLALIHEASGGAQRFLYEITGHFVGNPKLMSLFPECVPDPRKQRINKSELQLPRKSFWAEPTFDTFGVGAKSQGKHFDKIKLDDIFGDKARDSRVERESTIQWFDNIQSFLINLNTGHIDICGTRYSLDDVYAHAMNVYEDELVRYIRKVEEYNEETGQHESVFPEHFSKKRLRILRKNKKVWAAQYANDPREGLAEFDKTWKKFYERSTVNPVILFTGYRPIRYSMKDLDRLILIDPHVSKSPGIVVTGVDKNFNIFTLDAIKEELSHLEFVDKIFQLVQKWWPRGVCMEEVVFSEIYSSWIKREQEIRNVRFNIIPYKPPKDKLKFERVSALETYFSSGQIFFHQSQHNIIEEFDNFGATEDYHMLDALAQGPDFWRPAVNTVLQEEDHTFNEERLAAIDMATGYSKI